VGGHLDGTGLLRMVVTLKPGQIGVIFTQGQPGRKKRPYGVDDGVVRAPVPHKRNRREKSPYAVEYVVPLMLSDEIGSKLLAKKWVTDIREVSRELEKLSLEDSATRQGLAKRLQVIPAEAKAFLDTTTAVTWPSLSDLDQENYVAALLVLAQFPEFRGDFVRYTNRIPDAVASDKTRSFVTYLKAVGCLYHKEYACAQRFSRAAMEAEPSAIEPILVQAISLDASGRYKQAIAQEPLISKEYGEALYKSPNDSPSAYILFGDLAIAHRSFQHAVRFYQSAWQATNTFGDRERKAYLCVKLALAYKRVGDLDSATHYLAKAKDYAEHSDNPETILKSIEEIYRM
jgi:tetratricopeptide (TPR) repeat protein